MTESSGSIDGTAVTINASVPNVFTVTMSGLRTESSGWYYCVKGDLQMPVHVTVTSKYYKSFELYCILHVTVIERPTSK